jgi:uncharacterized ferritin-like protein (DUF455 family)
MKTLGAAIAGVMKIPVARQKAMATCALNRDWLAGRLAWTFDVAMPDRPGRPGRPEYLPPNRMPNRRRGGSPAARIAMLHAFAHIEFNAIDLALDAAGRFGEAMPHVFVTDWLSVAADEAMHFALLERRLQSLGSHYGALPAHDGLWEAAESTRDDLLARLAIVPMVLEARGLDVSPATVARLESAGDARSAAILKRIYSDEIRHVGIGSKWFLRLCREQNLVPGICWQNLVATRFRGALKPPFNDSARESAGLPREFYAPLAPLETVRQ